jgi:hypothetical protein
VHQSTYTRHVDMMPPIVTGGKIRLGAQSCAETTGFRRSPDALLGGPPDGPTRSGNCRGSSHRRGSFPVATPVYDGKRVPAGSSFRLNGP